SDAIGVLKEELDAGEGGSGLSFGDLLPDRAGILFAQAATRDRSAARRMQQRLSQEFPLDALMPPGNDLPDGLSDADVQSAFGGVGGSRSRLADRECRRRLESCAALQCTVEADAPPTVGRPGRNLQSHRLSNGGRSLVSKRF